MDCPRCKLALVRDSYEGLEVDICHECWGLWLDTGELEAILDSKEFEFSPEEKQEILEGRAERKTGPLKPVGCPKCQVRMERLYLDPSVYLVIDLCRRHGVWLDTGEIKLVQTMADASKAVNRLLVRKIKSRIPDKS